MLAVAGPRKAVYITAVHTGLRRSELAELRRGQLHLDAPKPFLVARSSTSKNHQEEVIWLRGDVPAVLRDLFAGPTRPRPSGCSTAFQTWTGSGRT